MGYGHKDWWRAREYTLSERGAAAQLQLVLTSSNTGLEGVGGRLSNT